MPLDKSGTYRANPQVARMHDAHKTEPPISKKPDPGQQDGGKGHVELHDHGDGTYHTVHHRPDGSSEEKQHGNHHEAHHAMNEQMDHDGCVPAAGASCEHSNVSTGEDYGETTGEEEEY